MTWMQTIKGRRFSLVDPDPAQVDFEEVAESLGKLARFNGHTVGYPGYSVAQHCVLGAEGLAHDMANPANEPYMQPKRMAALFVLHDAREAYMGDLITPVVAALDYIRWPDGPRGNSGLVKQLVCDLGTRLDVAIHTAADVDLPTPAERAVLHNWDQRMMAAERLAFMDGEPEPWPGMSVEPAPVDWGVNDPDKDGFDCRLWYPQLAAREWLWAFGQYVRGEE